MPGGDLNGDFEAFVIALQRDFPWLPERSTLRIARAYGSRARRWLGTARSPADLGLEIAPGLHERELEYLRASEWACTAEDVLWRRSKLGLHLPPDAAQAVADWFASRTKAETLA